MKNSILLPFIAAALSLSSCKKDRTCTCTTTDIGNGSTDVSTSVTLVGHATKGEAKKEANCYSYKATITGNGSTTQETQDCTLK